MAFSLRAQKYFVPGAALPAAMHSNVAILNPAAKFGFVSVHFIARKDEHADQSAMQTKRTTTMTMTNKIVGTALVASLALGLAAPASASGWGRGSGHMLRQEIAQLDRKVDRAAGRGMLSRSQTSEMRWNVDRVERKLDQYAANGVNGDEVHTIRLMIRNVDRKLAGELRENGYHGGYRERHAGRDDWRYEDRRDGYRGDDERYRGDRYDRSDDWRDSDRRDDRR